MRFGCLAALLAVNLLLTCCRALVSTLQKLNDDGGVLGVWR